MCPIETPEGPNIGLIVSLANYTRVNEYGFLETPIGRSKTARSATTSNTFPLWMRTLLHCTGKRGPLAQGGVPGEAGLLREKGGLYFEAAARPSSSTWTCPRSRSFRSLHPCSFLEHDDANRALMGSNMQRQAVPAHFPRAAESRHRNGGQDRLRLGRVRDCPSGRRSSTT